MISNESNLLIEIIENIPDKELQNEYFKRYLVMQKQNKNEKLENNNQLSLKTVLDWFTSKPKSVGIHDLQNEISQIKFQINSMLIQNEDLEIRLKTLEKGKNPEDIENIQLEEGESSQLFVNTITKMITQKWHVKIKLFVKPDFSKEFIALVDSGADINCIHEGLIPVKYFEQTLQTVVGANKQPLQIEHKISNVHVYNKNICYKISLLLVKDMNK